MRNWELPATGGRYRSLAVATRPIVWPVSLAEAKAHLRVVDNTDDDAYIVSLIATATQWCEDFCDRTFADQQYTVAFDDWPAHRIELPRPPVRLNATAASATVTISYVDQGGTTQTLTWSQSGTQQFRLDRDHVPALVYPLYLASWPAARLDDKALQITYLAGYGNPLDVPKQAVHAINMLIGHWYFNREAVLTGTISKEIELAVAALLSPLRWRQYA